MIEANSLQTLHTKTVPQEISYRFCRKHEKSTKKHKNFNNIKKCVESVESVEFLYILVYTPIYFFIKSVESVLKNSTDSTDSLHIQLDSLHTKLRKKRRLRNFMTKKKHKGLEEPILANFSNDILRGIMTNDEVEKMFLQLREWSMQEDQYSIRDFAKEIEVPYKTILKFSQENEDLKDEFEIARCQLSCHVHDAINSEKMSFKEGIRYLYENDYEIKEMVRIEGGEVPDDPEEFDAWVEEQIARDALEGIFKN